MKSVLLSVMFSNTLFKKNILGSIFLCTIWPGNLNFKRHFFPNCRNPARPCSKINPVSVKWKAAWNDFWYIASSLSNLPCPIIGIKGRFGALFQGSLQMTQLIPQSRIYPTLPIPTKITEKPLQRSALTPLVSLFSCTFNYLIFTENLNSSFLLEWNIAVLLAHRHLLYTNIPQYDSISVQVSVIQCTLV